MISISTIDAIKSTFTEKKEAAIETKEKVTPAGKFQITAERGSRLINWTSPNSIIDKVGEKQDLAVNNSTGWKSPAFDSELLLHIQLSFVCSN